MQKHDYKLKRVVNNQKRDNYCYWKRYMFFEVYGIQVIYNDLPYTKARFKEYLGHLK